VCFRRGRIYQGTANAPTTHVLKPDSDKLPQSTANEAFCMKLAARAGLPVVDPELVQWGARVFLIARSDRTVKRDRVRRLHEIDFCQAGNFTSQRKYEKDGGPGLARLFELGSQHLDDWPRARVNLIKWVIFNYLIGNRDTHAKNLSMRLTVDGVRLAPFYDLLSTAVYSDGEKEMSLKVGGQNRAHAVVQHNWRRFARDIHVEWVEVVTIARRLAAALPSHGETIAARMALTRAEKSRVNTVMRFLAGQARHLQKSLASTAA